MSSDFIIPFSILSAGLSIIWLRILYYKCKNSHLELRLETAKAITKVIEGLKKDYNLTKKQKAFLNSVLDIYESKRIVRGLLLLSIFRTMDDKGESEKLSELGVKESDKLFADIVAFVVLCVLHASTYNFFLGGIFRLLIFADVIQSSKLEKAAAERLDFVKRPDVLSVFGNMPKAA